MSLKKREWENKRCELENSLYCLSEKRYTDPEEYEYRCQILASIYNQTFGVDHVQDFMDALATSDLYALSAVLTNEEYGEPA